MKNYNILVFPVLILIVLLACAKDKSNKAVDIYNEYGYVDVEYDQKNNKLIYKCNNIIINNICCCFKAQSKDCIIS